MRQPTTSIGNKHSHLVLLAIPVHSRNCRNEVTNNEETIQHQETSENDMGNSRERAHEVTNVDANEALYAIIDGSIDFSANIGVIMPRIEEWFVQIPLQHTFSAIILVSNPSYSFCLVIISSSTSSVDHSMIRTSSNA
jgi:hypothetical protein